MSFLGIHILSDAAVQHLKDAGHQVETFAVSETTKVIAAAKTTDLGKAATDAIAAVSSHDLSGPQKFEAAVAAFLPTVLHYATQGGFSGVIKDVESFGRQMLQTVFDDTKSSTAGQVASAVGTALGL